ncbi:iron complex transport system ATP-binding protein [Haloechinothrix alba]|uniref:Iron complex transport system ATP-binding protein n=1 Tax=Haloechinothrix alba TaxID=664784 RepID=A0A238YCL4_9PSEU|nr:ABC transporter ATP-binding protein [Haloechinothrix alba]SNR68877.1 iron complex transport system ATP-binding protein [Haloechinothrix alba]
MSIQVRGASWWAGGSRIVNRVSLEVPVGGMLGLIGPNGSGKSSLLRLIAGLRAPSEGAVLLDGRNITGLSRRDLARRVAFVEQEVSTEVDLTVTDVVALGRTPHRSAWGGSRDGDGPAIDHALRCAGLVDLRHRRWHSLSGGERQRTQIARALAQEPSELLLDEPTNHLDVAHQLELLDLVSRLPLTSVVALHDLNLAAMFCDAVLVLSGGEVVADGSPGDVLTEDLVRRVYDVDCAVAHEPDSARPHIKFLPPRRRATGTPHATAGYADRA